MRVYDCCIAHNEVDLLEVRFGELADVVYMFVVVEATTTHSGHPRDLLPLDDARFDPWRNKLRRVIVDDLPMPNPRDKHARKRVEVFQREAIMRGLHDAEPTDAVLVTDADEIVRPSALLRGAAVLRTTQCHRARFWQRRYQGYVDVFECEGWTGPGMALVSRGHSPQAIRAVDMPTFVVADGGWHFNAVGGPTVTRDKLLHWCHDVYSQPEYSDEARIAERLAAGRDLYERSGIELVGVELDWSFPKYLLDNRERFAHLTREGAREDRVADDVPGS